MKKIVGEKVCDYGDEMSSLVQQMTSNVDHMRGNHLWFYFKSMIPKSGDSSLNDGTNTISTNAEIVSHIERGIDKITQKMEVVIKALNSSCEISAVKKQISSVEEMIPELKHWLEVGCSKPNSDLKQHAECVLTPLEDLRISLVKLSELEKKAKDRLKQREKDTPKASKLQSDLESEKYKVQKMRESLSKVGLTIDEAMDPNNILDSMATSSDFLKAVRSRLALREKFSNLKRKLTLDDLLTWTDMPSENGHVKKPCSEADTTLQVSPNEGFLQALNTQLSLKYDVLTKREKALNYKLRMADEEKRMLQFQLEKVESNISELKVKVADLSKDWKMLDDFRRLADTYQKQK